MEKLGNIILRGEHLKPVRERLFQANCSMSLFLNLLVEAATKRIHISEPKFVIDEQNEEVIIQLYYYLINSNEFMGDCLKGILLIGPYGSGKTLLMESFFDVIFIVSNKIVEPIHSKEIDKIERNKPGYLKKRPLFIDDIGKEEIVTVNYGTVSKPFEDLINWRSITQGLTFGTANLKIDDMEYSGHTIDRMRQMFNEIVLPGVTRRH